MKRDPKLYIEDILQSIASIEKYIKSIKKDKFYQDELIQDGIIRRLEIIGEAVKQLPKDIVKQYPDVPWQKIAGLRNRLSHEYFGIILERVWNVIKKDLPKLKKNIIKIQEDLR